MLWPIVVSGQQMIEQTMLVRMVVGEMNALLDRQRCRAFGLDVDTHRLAQQARGKTCDRAVERSLRNKTVCVIWASARQCGRRRR
jgi:hypothetical protein